MEKLTSKNTKMLSLSHVLKILANIFNCYPHTSTVQESL